MQPFAVPTFPDELLFQAGDLPVEKIVGLMNQADQGIGDHNRVGVGEPGGIGTFI
jgi:hypothetical protein